MAKILNEEFEMLPTNDFKLRQIVDESIMLELNVAELYKIFNQAFPEDAVFWWKLFEEEENHATLIRKAGAIEIQHDGILTKMLPLTLQEIKEANKEIVSFIVEYESNPPSRETAFNVALEIENSAGEVYFQRFINKKTDNILIQLFQKLNNEDKDHVARLLSYMEEHGIKILKDT